MAIQDLHTQDVRLFDSVPTLVVIFELRGRMIITMMTKREKITL